MPPDHMHRPRPPRKVIVRDRDRAGPRVRVKSVRQGDSIRTFVTFTDGELVV